MYNHFFHRFSILCNDWAYWYADTETSRYITLLGVYSRYSTADILVKRHISIVLVTGASIIGFVHLHFELTLVLRLEPNLW